MNSNLTEIIINQAIGALVGAMVSLAISWYFYKKADLPSRISNQMLEMIMLGAIQDRLGGPFDISVTPSEHEIPNDTDVPYIYRFWLSKKSVQQGDSIVMLFRVVDDGLNFSDDGLEVTEASSMLSFPATRQGYGYFSCKVSFPDKALLGNHIVTFRLTDAKRKTHVQSLKLEVHQSSYNMLPTHNVRRNAAQQRRTADVR